MNILNALNTPILQVRVMREECPETVVIQPDDVAAYWATAIAPAIDTERENAFVILLSLRKRVIGHALVSVGSLDYCHVHPRDVFRPAVAGAAHSVILVHNHPDGSESPPERSLAFRSWIPSSSQAPRPQASKPWDTSRRK